MSHLCVIVSADEGRSRVPLPRRRRITIGRAPTCDIVLDDGSVSRTHAALHLRASGPVIEDLESSNGTFVLGHRIPQGGRAPLPLGATFEVGGTTLMLLDRRRLVPERAPARPRKSEPVVADPAARRVYALLEAIAPSELDVLVLGEPGAGKRMFAEALVARSRRAKQPLIAVDCGTLDDAALASALADADAGTILFERAHDLPASLRAKVVGPRRVATTRRGRLAPRRIYSAYPEGRALARGFPGFSVAISPLRARREDILPLARLFTERSAKVLHERVPQLSEQAANMLTRHEWPRNVRELQSVIERAVLEADGAEWIDLEHVRLPRYE